MPPPNFLLGGARLFTGSARASRGETWRMGLARWLRSKKQASIAHRIFASRDWHFVKGARVGWTFRGRGRAGTGKLGGPVLQAKRFNQLARNLGNVGPRLGACYAPGEALKSAVYEVSPCAGQPFSWFQSVRRLGRRAPNRMLRNPRLQSRLIRRRRYRSPRRRWVRNFALRARWKRSSACGAARQSTSCVRW